MNKNLKENLFWIYPTASFFLAIWSGYFFWPVNDVGLQLACILTAIIIIIVPTILLINLIE